MDFIVEHLIEILFGLIAAGALAFCKYLHRQLKNYKSLIDEQKHENLEELIDGKLTEIKKDIENVKNSIHTAEGIEQHHIELICASYRFRLIQLCKEYIKQGYMTQNQYDQLTEFYKLYSSLGGNGQAHEYYETAMKLELRP